jgi:hypothetical protein
MDTFTYLLSFLPVSLYITAVTAYHLASPSNTKPILPSYQKLPQRPISFSPPSQHPILTSLPTPDEASYINGTIKVPSCGLQPIPVNFSLSSQVCVTLISELQYIIADLYQQLLSEHLNGISFPFSSDSQTSPLPVYLVANITEQLYRSKFVLSLSLKLSPLESGLNWVRTPRWRSIMVLLEQSAQELDRGARKRNGAGLGSVLVLEVDVEEVHVLAELRLWRVVDGLPVMCES